MPSATFTVGSILLEELLARIDADIARPPAGKADLRFPGRLYRSWPVVARNHRSTDRARRANESVFLKGNHELIAIKCLSDRSLFDQWLRLGGVETLVSYGVLPETAGKRKQIVETAIGLSRCVAAGASSTFFEICKIRSRAAISSLSMPESNRTSSCRIRRKAICFGSGENSCRPTYDFGKIIVHGHTPAQRSRGAAEPDQYRYRCLCDRPPDMSCA